MDSNEYERIVVLYMNNIYRVAVNGCRNIADAEDVVQTTFIKLLERQEPFDNDEHIRKWLIRVAINECNSLWRTPWKKRTVLMSDITKPVFSTDNKTDLYHEIRELPAKYREIVHLYYYEDYSVKEISQIMKMSETAVQTRLHRAREKLREKLKGEWL